MDKTKFCAEYLKMSTPLFFTIAKSARSLNSMRERLSELINQMVFDTFCDYSRIEEVSIIRIRDCAHALQMLLSRRSDDLAGFSVAKAIRDVARGIARPDLTPAFYAELLHILLGLHGRGQGKALVDIHLASTDLKGREAAIVRSKQLDLLWKEVEKKLSSYTTGLDNDSKERRRKRRKKILEVLGGTESDWYNWHWQISHIVKELDLLEKLVVLRDEEKQAIYEARKRKLPFGITPYYLSLMDDDPEKRRDAAIRAQVIPTLDYVINMSELRARDSSCLDFMREEDTSPCDLITRRYPAICIFKPFNTCPQICVYCQRNWEIEDAMAKGAFAGMEAIERAVKWIKEHPAIHEVLITGGDPLALTNESLKKILDLVASIPSIERIRIGTRTPVTIPMRITKDTAALLGSYRIPGKREVALVTHIQHTYEVTPEMVEAIQNLREQRIGVYNQLVYTFYVSRRFEAAALRRLLRLIGVDPYYTFNTKGKEETKDYRVPIARLLQEQKEEARLLPGLARTDEAVFNVPGLGKNYLRAKQQRDLLSILPDGSRVYEFHPWEKNISRTTKTYVGKDVPILEYLERLEDIGECVSSYETIWYYF